MTTLTCVAASGPALATSIEYVTQALAPQPVAIVPCTGSLSSATEIERSANALASVTVVAVLFALSGSDVNELTAAVLVMLPAVPGAVATIEIDGAELALLRPAIVHVTSWPVWPHVQPE